MFLVFTNNNIGSGGSNSLYGRTQASPTTVWIKMFQTQRREISILPFTEVGDGYVHWYPICPTGYSKMNTVTAEK
jgi:hypothetical protein